jgi:hypothetical protein
MPYESIGRLAHFVKNMTRIDQTSLSTDDTDGRRVGSRFLTRHGIGRRDRILATAVVEEAERR